MQPAHTMRSFRIWPVPIAAVAMLFGFGACAEGAGQWKEKTQIVWDAGAGKFARRSFRAFDPNPELQLEFLWLPASEDGKRAGAISREGKLVWYRKSASPYDRDSRHSTYEGILKDGRPDGRGKLSVRLGLTYEGEWKGGHMEGEGLIEYATGDRYRGRFAAGRPDGSGTYHGPDGKVVKAAVPAQPILAAFAQPMQVAQGSGPVAMTIYVDRAANAQFKDADVEVDSYVYDRQGEGADPIDIRLNAPEIMARWKGNGVIVSDESSRLLDPKQFAPALLVVDIVNESDRDAQIVGSYLEVAYSLTDWEPYLEISGVDYLGTEEKFDPTFTIINEGWGAVQNSKITYSFGDAGEGGQSFTIDLGTFDQSQEASTLPGFLAAGVNVDAVRTDSYSCPSYEEVPNCLAQLVQSGLFGTIGGAMYAEDKHVYTQVSGVIDYGWQDSQGAMQQRRSPISIKTPVLDFVVGPAAEYAAASPIERNLPVVKLGLDQQNYRIPFNYRGAIGAQHNNRFALNLDADRSSHHQFRVVLQLGDGSIAATPPVDLLMFKPRAVLSY
jgi:hypothetical protein